MNAPNLLSALFGGAPPTLTTNGDFNLTINGDVIAEAPRNTIYVDSAGEAAFGDPQDSANMVILDVIEDTLAALVHSALLGTSERRARDLPKQRPSVGRIVHYHPVPRASVPVEPWAAIITAVYEPSEAENGSGTVCALTILPPGSAPYGSSEAIREGGPDQPGTWSFPSKV